MESLDRSNIKKILLTTTGLSSVGQGGGISSYVHDLATNFVNKGYKVTVYLVRQSEPVFPTASVYDYSFFQIPNKRCDESVLVSEIYKSILALNPDVIINNDVSYIAGLWPVLDTKIIRISVMHGFKEGFTWSNFGIQGKMAIYNWKYIDYIVCQNEAMVADASKKYHIPEQKFCCIHQTVNFVPVQKLEKSSFSILFAGGASYSKGADIAYNVAKELKNTSLNFEFHWCLPAGKYKKYFESDRRFVFHGALSRESFLQTLGNSDCILIPTRMDTGPLLLVEALAQGVIPLCNDVKSAIPDLIKSGKNGFIVKKNRVREYLRIIEDLSKKNIVSISDLAKESYQKTLTPECQVLSFEQLFRKNTSLMQRSFSSQNVVHFHLYNTDLYHKVSYVRILNKVINAFEIVMTDRLYKNCFKYLLK